MMMRMIIIIIIVVIMTIIIEQIITLSSTASRAVVEPFQVPIFQQAKSLRLRRKATWPSIGPLTTISRRG